VIPPAPESTGNVPSIPARTVARRLYQGRELSEPFDVLTWFEFSRAEASAFEELVEWLRATEEWRFVEREIDLRIVLN
jgi:hypothetical protein